MSTSIFLPMQSKLCRLCRFFCKEKVPSDALKVPKCCFTFPKAWYLHYQYKFFSNKGECKKCIHQNVITENIKMKCKWLYHILIEIFNIGLKCCARVNCCFVPTTANAKQIIRMTSLKSKSHEMLENIIFHKKRDGDCLGICNRARNILRTSKYFAQNLIQILTLLDAGHLNIFTFQVRHSKLFLFLDHLDVIFSLVIYFAW